MPNTISAEIWLENSPQAAEIRAARNEAVAAADTITGIGANVRKANFDATRAPLPTDDETQGYGVGSRWLWQGQEWVLADAAAGAARWLRQQAVMPQMFGAVGDGITDDRAAFINAFNQSSVLQVPPGNYSLTSEIDLPRVDAWVRVDPAAKFPDAPWDMDGLAAIIGPRPVLAYDALYKKVGADYLDYKHVVGRSTFMEALQDQSVVVSLYANAEARAPGSKAFGANFGTYVTGPGIGIALEIDSHNVAPDGLSYALLLDSVGSHPSEAACVIQPNGPNSPFLTGISFNNASGNNAITNNAIQFLNAGSAQRYIFAHQNMMFTSAVLETNVFIVGPSVPGSTGALRVDASAGGEPVLSAWGSATDINIAFKTKGTGNHVFRRGDNAVVFSVVDTGGVANAYVEAKGGNGGATLSVKGAAPSADLILMGKGTAGGKAMNGAGATMFEWGGNGIAFFGATETAKPTVTGAKGGNAALASLISGLAALGLVTDSTT